MMIAIFSTIDILIIMLLLISYQAKYGNTDLGWKKAKNNALMIIGFMLLQKVILGFPFGFQPLFIDPLLNTLFFIVTLMLFIVLTKFLFDLHEKLIITKPKNDESHVITMLFIFAINSWFMILLV